MLLSAGERFELSVITHPGQRTAARERRGLDGLDEYVTINEIIYFADKSSLLADVKGYAVEAGDSKAVFFPSLAS